MQEHVQHLSLVFEGLRKHILFSKKSKCTFAVPEIEYLGHVISAQGVHTDPTKVEVMLKLLRLACLRSLRRFLCLIGYYN